MEKLHERNKNAMFMAQRHFLDDTAVHPFPLVSLQYAVYLVYLGIAVWVGGWAGGSPCSIVYLLASSMNAVMGFSHWFSCFVRLLPTNETVCFVNQKMHNVMSSCVSLHNPTASACEMRHLTMMHDVPRQCSFAPPAEVAFWMQTGERQSARIRELYLAAILKQEIAFFDPGSSSGQIVAAVTGDVLLVQDAISEKVRLRSASEGNFCILSNQ